VADKDFAQLETTQFSSSQTAGLAKHKTTLIVGLAVVFSMICFAFGFFMGEKHGIESTQGKKHEELVMKLQNQQKELETLKQAVEKNLDKEAATSQVGELTFYNELPKQSIVPEPLHASEVSTRPAASNIVDQPMDDIKAAEKKLDALIQDEMKTTSRSFRVQVASFSAEDDAKNFLPSLSKLGISPQIQKVNLATMGTRYRVFTNSYSDETNAMRAKQLIKEKLKIDGILIQND